MYEDLTLTNLDKLEPHPELIALWKNDTLRKLVVIKVSSQQLKMHGNPISDKYGFLPTAQKTVTSQVVQQWQ